MRWLFDALLEGHMTLVVSTPILLEYEEVIGERTTPAVAQNVLSALLALPNVERVDAYLAAGATALITHDAHFSVLDGIDFPPVHVVSAESFARLLDSG